MQYSQLLTILRDAKLSPEQFAARIGLSGMTLRRWSKRSKDKTIGKVYEAAIRDGLYALILDGTINAEAPEVQALLSEQHPNQVQAAMKYLGLPDQFSKLEGLTEEQVVMGLSQVAKDASRRSYVDKNEKKINAYSKLGGEWPSRIKILWTTVKSKKLSTVDKMVAYGALFYLLTPFDLIPDVIPVFGLFDDLGILGIAACYLLKKISDKS